MELHGVDRAHPDGGREVLAVFSDRRRFCRHRAVIRMAEVGKATVGDAIEKAVLAANLQLVPAEVRDFENSFKLCHVALKKSETCAVRSFVAGFIERLKAQADSQERLAARPSAPAAG